MSIKKLSVAFATASVLLAGGVQADDQGRAIGVTCFGCHGTDGVSVGAAPSIKGLPASHTANALKEFKSGKRYGTIMPRVAKGYSDAQIDAVANYFANMK